MKAGTWFIKNIGHIIEAAAQMTRNLYPLRFTAGEVRYFSGEAQIAKAHINELLHT